jgi:hypothetical protein
MMRGGHRHGDVHGGRDRIFMSQNHLSARVLTAAIAAVLVLVVGITWAGASNVGPGDTGLMQVGQNGKGKGNQGNGQGQGQSQGNGQGQGNGNGQNEDQDDDADEGEAPEDVNEGQGNGQGQDTEDTDEGEAPEDAGQGQGNGNGQSQAAANQGEGAENANEAAPLAAEASPAPGDDDADGKISVCHMTGSESNPSVFISISENARDAHEAHGDIMDVESEDECPTGDGDAGATPVASPAADD